MIGRKTIGKAEPMEMIVYLFQHIEQHPLLFTVFKNNPVRILSGGDMIDSLSILNPQRSRHTKLLHPPTSNLNINDLTPFLNPELEWGTSVLEVELEEKHLQPFGYVHGGVIASVMDAAAFWAVFPQVKDGMGFTTVEIKVNYLAPVQKGKLVAKGRCIKIGKTLALGDVFISGSEGNLLAHGTATMMIVPDLRVEGQENLPPKLI
jgi:uncharacterized protein (TIGR00369 family)